ncbi:MAG: glycosyltransferase family 39 protein [Candidatus Omnitrophica bacterium]|nr:glycosyltransferase family 39 protein [Candidatus Omnitrophota bacterium]
MDIHIIVKNKKFIIALLIALAIKISLFIYAEIHAPQAKFQTDSIIYTQTAENLAKHGAFTRHYNDDGSYSPHLLRTPGYPFFLAILHGKMKIPYSGVILIQIVLTILVAFITYKTALNINPRFAYLSALIVLFDSPVTIFSLMLLTETVFLFLISIFMYLFILYLKEKKIKFIILSALIVATLTYVRPVGYFFGIATGVFIIYFMIRMKLKKLLIHLLIFLIIVYSLIGLWHLRNYRVSGKNTFSTVTLLAASYRKVLINNDELTRTLPKIPYYVNVVSRSLVFLMTKPGTLKNFNSPTLKQIGKIIGYPWMVFWLIGFLVGISKVEKNFYLQFLLFVVLYFICASIAGILFGVSSRQRMPMVPFIAILSAHGWIWIASLLKKKGIEGSRA